MPCTKCCEDFCRCESKECWGQQEACIICGDRQDCCCYEDAKEKEEDLREATFDRSKYNI